MTTMSWDMSVELARDDRFTRVDLDEIRREVKPNKDWGPDENWEEAKQTRCAERVFGIFTFFEMCQTIGWVEHTNDWDWWIQITDTSGTLHHFDCGSFFQDITDLKGQVWDNAKDASEKGEWHGEGDYNNSAITILGIIVSDEDLTPEEAEQSVRFKVSEISNIVIGYDT